MSQACARGHTAGAHYPNGACWFSDCKGKCAGQVPEASAAKEPELARNPDGNAIFGGGHYKRGDGYTHFNGDACDEERTATPDEQPKTPAEKREAAQKFLRDELGTDIRVAADAYEPAPAKPIETDSELERQMWLQLARVPETPDGWLELHNEQLEYFEALIAQREAEARIDQELAAQASLVANRIHIPEWRRMWEDSEARLKALRGETTRRPR